MKLESPDCSREPVVRGRGSAFFVRLLRAFYENITHHSDYWHCALRALVVELRRDELGGLQPIHTIELFGFWPDFIRQYVHTGFSGRFRLDL